MVRLVSLVWFLARCLNVNQVKEGWQKGKGAPPKGPTGTKIGRLEGAWHFQKIACRLEGLELRGHGLVWNREGEAGARP